LRAALRALEAGEVIALFPQGRMILPGETRKLKRGAFWLAQKTNTPIYPAFMSGIAGVGHIFRGILWRSHAKLVSYPPLDWRNENNAEYLQTLFDGKMGVGKE